MKALQLLSEIDYQVKKALYPNTPAHAIPKTKFRDGNANELAKSILAWLRLHHHKAWRQSSEGRYRPGKSFVDVIGRTRLMRGTYLRGTNNGVGDVCAIVEGKFISLEIKIGRDQQSTKQKQYQQEVEASGALYVIVRSYDEFYRWYLQHCTEKDKITL